MDRTLSLRIDIDTFHGCGTGVPALARALDAAGARASFFVVAGRDTSGRHVKRLVQPGYVRRLRAVGVVGVLRQLRLRSLLYGTVLQGPRVAAGHARLLRSLAADGHEIGLHGLDHALWAEREDAMSEASVVAYWSQAAGAFQNALGFAPRAAAAPNWRASETALQAFEQLPMDYRSDTRGRGPFLPLVRGTALPTLQVPVNLPACHEVLVSHGVSLAETVPVLLDALDPGVANVWNLHDWFEGLRAPWLVQSVLDGARARGYRVVTLAAAAAGVLSAGRDRIDRVGVVRRAIPGGVGTVSCRAGDYAGTYTGAYPGSRRVER